MSVYRSRFLLLTAAFVALALAAPPADAQVFDFKVVETYKYLAFVGPQLPRWMADTTGQKITECDGTVTEWGSLYPWLDNWVEITFEPCPFIYFSSITPLNNSKIFGSRRAEYARGAALMRQAEFRSQPGVVLRRSMGTSETEVALLPKH